MRGSMFAVVVAISCPSLASAGDEVMANYFGNTVVVSSGSHATYIHYKPDHTFDTRATTFLGDFNIKGTWQIDDKENLCRVIDENSLPFPVPGASKPVCVPWKIRNVGETWTIDVNGQAAQFSLEAGLK